MLLLVPSGAAFVSFGTPLSYSPWQRRRGSTVPRGTVVYEPHNPALPLSLSDPQRQRRVGRGYLPGSASWPLPRPPFIYKFLYPHITRPPKTASGQFGGARASAPERDPGVQQQRGHSFDPRSLRASKKTHRGFVAGHLPSTHEGSWPVSFCNFFPSFLLSFVLGLSPQPLFQPQHTDLQYAYRKTKHLETSSPITTRSLGLRLLRTQSFPLLALSRPLAP